MKYPTNIAMLLLLTVTTLLGHAQQAKQPSVMVLPHLKSGMQPEEVRKELESDPMMEQCISYIKALFTDRGFTLIDFASSLSNLKTDQLQSEIIGAETDVMKQMIEASNADIAVRVTPRVITDDAGLSEVLLMVDVQEARLSNSIVNANATSGKFKTNDSRALAERALDDLANNFIYQVEEGFGKMVREGRAMKVKIEFKPDCGIDAYTEVGENGNNLEAEIDEWAVDNGMNNQGGVTNSSKNLIEMDVNVPIYDDNGRPYRIIRMRNNLTKSINGWIRSKGCKVDLQSNEGQYMRLLIVPTES